MKQRTLIVLVILLTAAVGRADEASVARFLKACAWGTAIGTGVGVVSLAFEDKPSEHSINVARGASLGLYGGIAYGLLQVNDAMKPRSNEDLVWLAPFLRDGRLDGANLHVQMVGF